MRFAEKWDLFWNGAFWRFVREVVWWLWARYFEPGIIALFAEARRLVIEAETKPLSGQMKRDYVWQKLLVWTNAKLGAMKKRNFWINFAIENAVGIVKLGGMR